MNRAWLALFTFASCCPFSLARAEDLGQAIADAYQFNPTLQSARAQQRSVDETYVQARAGYRPTASLAGSYNYDRNAQPGSVTDQNTVNVIEEKTGGFALTLAQPLYTGGRTTWAVRNAEASILSGRQSLRASEATVLQNVITAYVDVLRDTQILVFRQNDLDALRHQLQEADAKHTVGTITRTDVFQTQVNLHASEAASSAAQAQLQISRANFAALVGRNPGTLEPPPLLPKLPATIDEAFDLAETDSPTLLQAKFTELASADRVAQARAANHPSISANATLSRNDIDVTGTTRSSVNEVTAGVTLTQPLITGGVNNSLIRQAIEQNNQDRLNVENMRRTVVVNVSQAWNQMTALGKEIGTTLKEVEAAKQEVVGMEAEYRVALRSTLEVLSAEEAVINAEIALAQAQHDQYVEEAMLLSNTGRLEARYLISGLVKPYDPKRHFQKVAHDGAVPWEGLVSALDKVADPAPHLPNQVPAPGPAANPGPVQGAEAPNPDAPLSTSIPDRDLEVQKTPPVAPPIKVN